MQYRATQGLRAAICAAFLMGGLPAGQAVASQQGVDAPSDVRELMQWVTGSADHKGKPFAIVDKKQARLYVFDAQGRLVDSSAVLLGAAVGDDSVPGVGARAQRGEVAPEERTTPAGRFESVPGKNLDGEHVVWVDYSSAFAIHRLRPGRSYEPRRQRLGTKTPEDNRASLGCVVVPEEFYTQVVQRVLGNTRGVVYVMPETRPATEMFGASGA